MIHIRGVRAAYGQRDHYRNLGAGKTLFEENGHRDTLLD